jgi:hypothetical protein
MKITLKCEQPSYDILSGREGPTERTVTHEFTVGTIDEALENYELFLRGLGYFFDGKLDIVEEEPVTMSGDQKMNYDFTQLEQHWNNTVKNTVQSDICKQCGLPENVMKQHQCWDPKCPIKR